MQPIRFYLIIKLSSSWTSTVHRDYESLLDSWNLYRGRLDITSIIHVGLQRSEFELFENVAALYLGKVLLTASAKWALYNVCKSTSQHVGIVEGIPIYLAIDGWGYTVQPQDLGLDIEESQSITNIHQFLSSNTENSSNWLNDLKIIHADIFKAANAAGITDEKSYWQLEHSLPNLLRKKIGLFRFHSLSKDQALDDVSKVLKCAPPWIFECNIIDLELSVRSYNALNAIGIYKVSDLTKFSNDSLLKIKNFGKGSLVNVVDCLLKRIHPTVTQGQLEFTPKNIPFLSNEPKQIITEHVIAPDPVSFNAAIQQSLLMLDPKISKIIKYRMGFECEAMTLNEIGNVFGFTRERARQIESKGIKKLSLQPIWREIFVSKLNRALDNRIDSLTLSGLGIIEPWFTGVEKLVEPFKYAIERFTNDSFYLVRANGQIFISGINQDKWNQYCRIAINLLETGVNFKWTTSEAKRQIGDLLPLKGNNLRLELWIVASRFAHFSTNKNGEQYLVGVGRSAEVLVETVLAESHIPLHYLEIAKKIKEKYGKDIEPRRAHNAAQVIAHIYGRGTYGLLKHCLLSSDELKLIKNRCEDLIVNNSESRQWSCTELAEILENEGLDFDNKINRYIVNIALSQSTLLSDLKRMIWIRATDAPAKAAHRVDLSQAVESLLINAGHPMSSSEIKDTIQRERGLGETFQIHPTGSIIRIGQGIWGIIDRDLPISQNEQEELVQNIEILLKKSNKGIHLTEISELISDLSPSAKLIEDPTVFFTLAQRSGKMRISPGKYLFLPEWGEPRRLSPNQAITNTITEAGSGGLSASEITNRASKLLGREIKNESIYSALYALGARFDETLSKWFAPDEGVNDDEEIS